MRANLNGRQQRSDAGRQQLAFVSIDMRRPYIADFSGEDGSKTAHYMLRWVASTGERGP